MNSEHTSPMPLTLPPRWLLILFMSVAFIGFIDAVYLTAVHFLGQTPGCSLLEGCEEVTTSAYATVGFIPISLFGAAYYLLVFLFTLLAADGGKRGALVAAVMLTWVAFAVTLVLIFLQLFVIKALCLYCLISALTSTILFVMGIFLLHYKKGQSVL
ncbi:MAG: vitamin K epoxide reductase family protein [bacterium]|nr:vitamin K epoxide reductase family protein [bacterium]